MEPEEMEAQDRVKAAVAAEDEEYIEQFKQGALASDEGKDLAGNENQAFLDGYKMSEEHKASPNRNRLSFHPHPMGGIGVTCIGSDGTMVQARLELDAAALAATHLTALNTMMIQTAYMMQAQAQQQTQSGLVIPGR